MRGRECWDESVRDTRLIKKPLAGLFELFSFLAAFLRGKHRFLRGEALRGLVGALVFFVRADAVRIYSHIFN